MTVRGDETSHACPAAAPWQGQAKGHLGRRGAFCAAGRDRVMILWQSRDTRFTKQAKWVQWWNALPYFITWHCVL